MIVAALFGGASKYAEIYLGIKYREINKDGSTRGGAMYYLKNGLGQKWLGVFFSILVIPFAFVISGIVDTNTIALTLQDHCNIPTMLTGVFLALIVAAVVFGGLKRVGYVCSLIAPFMGGLYIIAGLAILIINIRSVPAAVAEVICSAFSGSALAGGTVGTVLMAMKNGIARGVYSNEAGLGTAAMIHSQAEVDNPVDQALWGPVEVFLDTVIVCTISALAIVMSGLWKTGEFDGASLTVAAFRALLPGNIGAIIAIASVILFGFSCLISFYTYAEQAAEFLFGAKSKLLIKILWVFAILVGSQTTLGFAWDLADTFNGLMIIPNLIGIILLSNQVARPKIK